MKMKKTYYLNKDVLPTIPVPHDCIIKKICIEHKWLIFTFEDAGVDYLVYEWIE